MRRTIFSKFMFILMLIAYLVLLILLAGCSTQQQESNNQITTLPKIKLAYSTANYTYLPMYVAKETGLYQQYGLETGDMVSIQGGPPIVQALLAGEVDAALVGGSPLLQAFLKGGKVTFIGSVVNIFPYYIFTNDKINKQNDFINKTIGVSKIGSESHVVYNYLFKQWGIRPNEVKYVAIGGSSERIAAIQAGSVDSGALVSPLQVKAQKAGIKMFIDVTNLKIPWVQGLLGVSEDHLQKDQDLYVKLLKATVEGGYYIAANKEKSKQVLAKYLVTQDEELLEAGYNDFLKIWVKDMRPSRQGIVNVLESLVETTPQAKNANPDDFGEMSLINQLEQDGFFTEMARKYNLPLS